MTGIPRRFAALRLMLLTPTAQLAIPFSRTPSRMTAASISTPVIKALSIGDAGAWPAHTTLLLDACDPVKRGGTGQTIDWDAAARLAAARRILLAGGLTPDNVAEAIARVRPFGVDVSSGVEQAPGIKDHRRVRALFEAIHDTGHITARP